jgi:hypothetical protein
MQVSPAYRWRSERPSSLPLRRDSYPRYRLGSTTSLAKLDRTLPKTIGGEEGLKGTERAPETVTSLAKTLGSPIDPEASPCVPPLKKKHDSIWVRFHEPRRAAAGQHARHPSRFPTGHRAPGEGGRPFPTYELKEYGPDPIVWARCTKSAGRMRVSKPLLLPRGATLAQPCGACRYRPVPRPGLGTSGVHSKPGGSSLSHDSPVPPSIHVPSLYIQWYSSLSGTGMIVIIRTHNN